MSNTTPIVGILIAAAFCIALALAVYSSIRRSVGDRRLRVSEPACPSCRYPVRGLSAMHCPECGADFREVGIVTPSMRPARGSSLLALFSTWTLSLIFLAIFAVPLLSQVPGIDRRVVDVNITLQSPAAPVVPPIRIDLRATDTASTFVGAESMRLTMGASPVTLGADRTPGGWRITEAPDRAFRGATIDVPVLLATMAAANRDPADPATAAEANELMMLLDLAAVSIDSARNVGVTALRHGGTGLSFHSGPAPWFVPTMIAVWVLIWGAGVYLLITSRRSKPASSDAAPASPRTAPVPAAAP